MVMKKLSNEDIFKILADADPDLTDVLGSFVASYIMLSTSDDYNIQSEALLRCIGQLEVLKMVMMDKVNNLINIYK